MLCADHWTKMKCDIFACVWWWHTLLYMNLSQILFFCPCEQMLYLNSSSNKFHTRKLNFKVWMHYSLFAFDFWQRLKIFSEIRHSIRLLSTDSIVLYRKNSLIDDVITDHLSKTYAIWKMCSVVYFMDFDLCVEFKTLFLSFNSISVKLICSARVLIYHIQKQSTGNQMHIKIFSFTILPS